MKPRNMYNDYCCFVMAVFLGVAFQSRVSAQQAGETKTDEKKDASVLRMNSAKLK